MATIKELADRKARLEAELSEVRAEIASRAGEVDPPEEPKPARKTAARKTAAK